MADLGMNTNGAHELQFEDELHIRDVWVQAQLGEETSAALRVHVTLWAHVTGAAISDALSCRYVCDTRHVLSAGHVLTDQSRAH
jgi:hypothetical protein